MKRIFCILFCLFFLASCSKTPETKANIYNNKLKGIWISCYELSCISVVVSPTVDISLHFSWINKYLELELPGQSVGV